MQSIGRAGVSIPDGQLSPQERTEPNKVLSVMEPAVMIPVRYSDEHGRVHHVVVFKAGNEYYMPPNAEQWAASLRPLRDWMKKGIEAQLPGDGPLDAPSQDTVDVVADG